MIQFEDLLQCFESVSDIGSGIAKCREETASSVWHYYLKPAPQDSAAPDLLVMSEDREDDDFVRLILDGVSLSEMPEALGYIEIGTNPYALPGAFIAPASFHSYFKGMLDDRRERLALVLPAYRCEFSGDESVEDFVFIRRHLPSLDWLREARPKILMRFDNPATGGGTIDEAEVLVGFDTVLREIDNLDGVVDAFLELRNYREAVMEVLSLRKGEFVLIRDRDDTAQMLMPRSQLVERLWEFVSL